MIDESELELADLSGDPEIKNAWSWTMLYCECPHCDKVNILNLGDMNAPDIEVLECWSCDKKSWIMDKGEAELHGYKSVEDGYSAKGEQRV